MRNARYARDRAPAIDHGTVAPSGPSRFRAGHDRPDRSQRGPRHNRLSGRRTGCAVTVRSCFSSSSPPWSAHSSGSRWRPSAMKYRRRRAAADGRPAIRVVAAADPAEVIAAEAVAVRPAVVGAVVAAGAVVALEAIVAAGAVVAAGAIVVVAGVVVVAGEPVAVVVAEVVAVGGAAVAVGVATRRAGRSGPALGRPSGSLVIVAGPGPGAYKADLQIAELRPVSSRRPVWIRPEYVAGNIRAE